jgi:hypothetical protein
VTTFAVLAKVSPVNVILLMTCVASRRLLDAVLDGFFVALIAGKLLVSSVKRKISIVVIEYP